MPAAFLQCILIKITFLQKLLHSNSNLQKYIIFGKLLKIDLYGEQILVKTDQSKNFWSVNAAEKVVTSEKGPKRATAAGTFFRRPLRVAVKKGRGCMYWILMSGNVEKWLWRNDRYLCFYHWAKMYKLFQKVFAIKFLIFIDSSCQWLLRLKCVTYLSQFPYSLAIMYIPLLHT